MLTAEGICVPGRLRDVSLSVRPGDLLAVLGESGAGKTSLVQALLGLVRLQAGSVAWQGQAVVTPRGTAQGWPVGVASLVMQDPLAALNPGMSAAQSIAEPLHARGQRPEPERLAQICAGLDLSPEVLDRPPRGLSLGQAQRVCIARALIAAPRLVLFDEPLSALDTVTQKHTARLMASMQAAHGFAAIVVTHDIGFAAAHATHVAVMQSGRLVETAAAASFFRAPASACGCALRDAAIALGSIAVAA
ncbi:MAG: ABC transporter ATP-binding protein [Alkalilacustris sp.]